MIGSGGSGGVVCGGYGWVKVVEMVVMFVVAKVDVGVAVCIVVGVPYMLYLWLLGRGDNRAVPELGFAHVTTKTWAYSGVFIFSRNFFWRKNCPPPPKALFENTMGNPFFGTPFFGTKRSKIFFRTEII